MIGSRDSQASREANFIKLMYAKSRAGLISVGIASGAVNILYLTGSVFMLQVYDRVIPSRSIPTLIALSTLALILFLFQGAFDILRNRMLMRVSGLVDELISRRVFTAMLKAPIRTNLPNEKITLMQDFDQARSFLSSPGPSAFFDLPWVPVYIGICFLFHPIIGIVAIAGSAVLVSLTLITHYATRGTAKRVHILGGERHALMTAAQRNADVVEAMGMGPDIASAWDRYNEEYRRQYRMNADTSNSYITVSKMFRIALQSGVLAVGAVLVIQNEATGGIIIASSILTARALAPVEQAIANWRGFAAAQQAWVRLHGMLKALPEAPPSLQLPAPTHVFSVERLASGPPGHQKMIVSDVNFTVNAGSAVGIIGPSGSGKSSLARAIAGIWPIYRGSVRLDGASVMQWDDTARGKHVGYLPQDIELFTGTIAQNISRFRADAPAEAIIEAAKTAGCHDLILTFPRGYDTELGRGEIMLSAGQRQRVALARALYGNPFLVIMDEPNSNLDAEGEAALSAAISRIRDRGGIVAVVAHRPSALAAVDLVVMMNEGRMTAFGPKDEVLAKILRRDVPMSDPRLAPLKLVTEGQE